MAQRTDKAEIIEKAKALMEKKGYSENKAAKELGVCQGTLNRWLLQDGFTSKPQEVNRDFNQPKKIGTNKGMEMVNLGPCVNCGKPVMVAKIVADNATWPIKHCTKDCRLGRKPSKDMEEAV